MQPNIIENFVNFSTCKTINDYFDNNVKLNKEGYSNIEVSRLLPYYDGFHLLNLLNKNNSDEALLYDLLNMMIQSVAFQFNFSKNDISIEHVNYRSFGAGQGVKGYHTDFYGDYNTSSVYTALLYLNDNYEGGEIIFYDGEPDNITGSTEYKPKIGSLFYFEGNENYAHSINPVTSGKRTLVLFQFRTDKQLN